MTPALVWITGAHGFIGRHVARTFADNGLTVVGLGHGAWPAMEARKWGVSHWLNGDVASGNLHTLRVTTGIPDYVVHLAGGSSVGSAITQPREDFNRTVVGTMDLFEWLRVESPTTRVLAASTAAVYGADHCGMIRETAVLRPYSPYGTHKLMMESICESYASSFGVPSIVARLFSVYGVGLKKQLLWDLCSKLQNDPHQVELGGNGDEVRDWVAVSDVASMFLKMRDWARPEVPKFNVGTGVGISVRDVAQRLIRSWHGERDSDTRLSFNGLSRQGDPFSLVASPEKLAKSGITCDVSVYDGIPNYVAWFKKIRVQ